MCWKTVLSVSLHDTIYLISWSNGGVVWVTKVAEGNFLHVQLWAGRGTRGEFVLPLPPSLTSRRWSLRYRWNSDIIPLLLGSWRTLGCFACVWIFSCHPSPWANVYILQDYLMANCGGKKSSQSQIFTVLDFIALWPVMLKMGHVLPWGTLQTCVLGKLPYCILRPLVESTEVLKGKEHTVPDQGPDAMQRKSSQIPTSFFCLFLGSFLLTFFRGFSWFYNHLFLQVPYPVLKSLLQKSISLPVSRKLRHLNSSHLLPPDTCKPTFKPTLSSFSQS